MIDISQVIPQELLEEEKRLEDELSTQFNLPP